MHITYLIVPAWSDQAGQCRIVCRAHDLLPAPDLQDYRRAPDLWREAGIMNSQGRLVCLHARPEHYDVIKGDEPLMAGTVHTFCLDQAGVPA